MTASDKPVKAKRYMMSIPLSTKRSRFYVAFNMSKAFVCRLSLPEAIQAWKDLPEEDRVCVAFIVEVHGLHTQRHKLPANP